MPKTEALKRAQRAYMQRMKQVKIWADPKKDADILDKLDQQISKSEYIKSLIRKDIQGGQK